MGCGSSSAKAASPPQPSPAEIAQVPTSSSPKQGATAKATTVSHANQGYETSGRSAVSHRPSAAASLFAAVSSEFPTDPTGAVDAASVPIDVKEQPPVVTKLAGIDTPEDITANLERVSKATAVSIVGYGKCTDGQGKLVIYYMIRIRLSRENGKITHILVYRRYSQFELLREKLLRNKNKHGRAIPVLPKKKYFGALRNLDFLNQRQNDLDIWLRSVSLLPAVEESEYYNLFLLEEADDAPPDFTMLKTVDDIGFSKILACADDTFSDDASELSYDSDLGTVSGNNDRTKSFERETEDVTRPGPPPPLPPIVEVDDSNAGEDGSAVITSVPNAPAKSLTGRSPSIRAAFELGAKRTPKIYFDGISSFGTGADIRKKLTLYYVLRIRYTDEQKCLELDINVYRRYSEFEKLRINLMKSTLHGEIPPLPKKKLFGRTNSSSAHAMQRKDDLQTWLNAVTALPHICFDEYFKEFVTKGANKVPLDFEIDDYFR